LDISIGNSVAPTSGELIVFDRRPEAVALASEIHPHVVLIASLPDLDGTEATRRITADPELSEVGVLILTYEEERDEQLFAVLRAGASGFLTSDAEPAELVRAVRVLAGGGRQLSPSLTRRLIDEFAASQPHPEAATPEQFDELTAREREVVALVALGRNHEIAERLVVSDATVKTHVGRSMVKLDARDRAKLVALAYQTGFAQALRRRGPGGSSGSGLVRR
jgi:DNA-binding NarL/FixJ family response regulator